MSHALLSPSGASRWLVCPPSARLESKMPDPSNAAAEEGTLAHALCELYLRNHLKLIRPIPYKSQLKELKANPLFDSAMDEHCLDYVTFVTDKLHALHEPSIFIEEKLDIQEFVPEGFGTVDCAMIADHILDITDFKYGKGVLVNAHENKQMMLYALGALLKYSLLYEISEVRMTIYQPRLNNYSSFEISAENLLAWGEEYVKPRAQLAFDGMGDFEAGSHCKFCKIRATCKTLATYNLELSKHAFEDANKLSDQDIVDILAKAADFKAWLTEVQNYALSEAVLRQKKWPGLKLVAGRSNRVLTHKDEVAKILKKAKIAKDLFMSEPELVGIGALEKNIGKAKLNELIGGFILKPTGAATLVPEWDKRAEINSTSAAVEAFADVDLTTYIE